jgi:hypothetical protein
MNGMWRGGAVLLVAASGWGCPDAAPEDGLGKVRIWTYPKGAQGWIDGELVIVRTPATLVKPAGVYDLELRVPGAEPYRTSVRVVAGTERKVRFDLPKPPDATVTVTSDVLGASVRINGYKRGETPLERAVTLPGPLDITVEGPGHRARAIRATLGIGEQRVFHVDFAETTTVAADSTGRLTLGLKPDGYVVDEEGRTLGETPLVRRSTEAGLRSLILRSLDGARERKVEVEVPAGVTAIYRFRLREEDDVPEGRRVPLR